jgi:hypothetical protein
LLPGFQGWLLDLSLRSQIYARVGPTSESGYRFLIYARVLKTISPVDEIAHIAAYIFGHTAQLPRVVSRALRPIYISRPLPNLQGCSQQRSRRKETVDTFDFILFLSQQPILLMIINQNMENTESIYILWIELVLMLVAAVVCKGVLILQFHVAVLHSQPLISQTTSSPRATLVANKLTI